MDSPMGAVMAFLLAILSAFVLGFVMWFYWDWFIMPVFNVEPIPYTHATGIALVLFVFTKNRQQLPDDFDEDDFVENALRSLVAMPIVYLAIGWVVQLFM